MRLGQLVVLLVNIKLGKIGENSATDMLIMLQYLVFIVFTELHELTDKYMVLLGAIWLCNLLSELVLQIDNMKEVSFHIFGTSIVLYNVYTLNHASKQKENNTSIVRQFIKQEAEKKIKRIKELEELNKQILDQNEIGPQEVDIEAQNSHQVSNSYNVFQQ